MEVYNYEVKQKPTKNFLKTVSSFANYNDGKIAFGLSNEGDTIGLKDIDEAKLTIENMINDCINPRPNFSIDLNLEEHVIILTVYEGENTPYYYKNKAYKRSDSSDVEVDREELNNLILRGKNLDYEQLPSADQSLNFYYFYSEAKIRMGIDEPDLDLLRSFNLYKEKQGYNIAALLLSDTNFYNIIDFVKFGESISEFNYRTTFSSISILEAFNKTIDLFEQYYSYEVVEGKNRNKYYAIPLVSFREALANAIVHRKWNNDAFISISFYNEKIEITSPGGLPNNLSIDIYLNRRVSSPRNPIISTVFQRFGYIDKLGTGIFRINNGYKESSTKPIFDISDDFVTVVLPRIKEKEELSVSKDVEKVYSSLSPINPITRSEIEVLTGFEKSKVIRLLNQMRDYDMIEVIGRGRATKYRLKDNDGL